MRVDSLPLASELSGEPGRLRLLEDAECFKGSECFDGRWEGVFVPLEEEPECLALSLSLSADDLLSSAFLRSSSFKRSVSVDSDSLYASLVIAKTQISMKFTSEV